MNNQNNPIVINLDDSTYAHSFAIENLVHRDEYKHVIALLEKQIQDIDKYEKRYAEVRNYEPYTYPKLHNTISILGGRGTGKTSFIMSVLRYFQTNRKEDVSVLDIIDPTLLEDSGHVFVLLIALINNKVNRFLSEGEITDSEVVCGNRRRWHCTLKKISLGLAMLDNLGNGYANDTNWQDDYYVMRKGFDTVSASFDLEKNFHDFVNTALDILKKRVFLLTFDDVDVDMQKGWKVLETIRKYITTPKILCVISGNIKLYSNNVRTHQWMQFKSLVETGFEEKDVIRTQVNELEGQYLLKILKMENRIHLASLKESINIQEQEYIIRESDGKDKPLSQSYDEIMECLGVRGVNSKQNFISYLLSLSLRSQISFLRSDINNKKVSVECVETFLSRMLANNISVDIAVQNPNMLVPIIANYLIRKEILKEMYQLMPQSGYSSINACVTGLSILFTKQVAKNPFLIFDYMLRVGLMRNMVASLTDTDEIKNVADYVNISQDGSLKNIVGMMMAYEEGRKLSDMSEHMQIYTLQMNSKDKKDSSRLDNVLKNKTAVQQFLGLIPLCALKKTYSNSSYHYCSIFLIVAAICQIMKAKSDKDSITRILKEVQIYRSYPIPTSDNNSNDGGIQEENIYQVTAEDDTLQKLVDILISWKTNFHSEAIVVPPYLLGRIITRFYSSVKNIRGENLGTQMHLSIISFLNACLIEEARERIREDATDGFSIASINFDNVISSETIFVNNLAKIPKDNVDSIIPFTKVMLSCPLLLAYIDIKGMSKNTNEIISKVVGAIDEDIVSWNMKHILSGVVILSGVTKQKPSFSAADKKWRSTENILKQKYPDLELLFRNSDRDLAVKFNADGLFRENITENKVKSFRDKRKS